MKPARDTTGDGADNLIRVTTRLSELMEAEVAMLRGARARDIQALQADKAALAAVYERLMGDVGKDPSALGRIDPARRRTLTAAGRRLEAAAADNAVALRTAIEANHRMMRAIADAVEDEKKAKLPYTRRGVLAGYGGRASRRGGGAVAVNQTL
ncbi:MAG: hypothetical protein AB7N54_07410 [Alphaproteobacteria bacterium]